MMKKIVFITLAVLLWGSCAPTELDDMTNPEPTTAKVHGTVVINGEPVNAAAILLTPGGGTKITGSDGVYDFSGLTPGRYELKVFKEGCQSFNKSIDLVAGKDESLVITLSPSEGNLSINKAFIDMGSNESNNLAGFTIKNNGTTDIEWKITNAASWITKVEPASATIPAGAAQAVSFTINRSKLSSHTADNYATLLVKSTSAGDGSVAELLVTVFGTGDGTNTTNDNSDLDYVMVGDLYVQTKDISESAISWSSAKQLCEASIAGGFDDWRLPTLEELALLYTERIKIGKFKSATYWSSKDITPSYTTFHYYIDFFNGNQDYSSSSSCYARAVRKNEMPAVKVSSISNISESSVTFNGTIENAGSPAYTERGFVYSTSHTPTINDSKVISYTATSATQFNAEVKNLVLGTTYYIRAYATSKAGTVYSDENTFDYTNQLPIVETLSPTDIGATTAVLQGNITSKGIPAYTERGFVYSTSFQNPTIDDTKRVVSGKGTGNFSLNFSGLSTGTTYYVRAYATNSEGTAYGKSFSFTPEHPDYVILQTAGLMVQKNDISTSSLSWSSAKQLCENSTIGGFTDWRLPTLNELSVLYNEREKIGNFRTSSSYGYWSSTLYTNDIHYGNYYYIIYFNTGNTSYNNGQEYARAVRSIR